MLACVVLAFLPILAQASSSPEGGPLVSAYAKAQRIDPLYQAALAERNANLISSRVAGSAYYPQMKVSTSQLENEDGGQRSTISIIQPIISADRYATLKEKNPRKELAEAVFRLKQNDLGKRFFKAFSELTLAREGLQQNKVRLDALQQQYSAGKRTFELGQGTITDMRDAEVRVLQAKAEDLKLRAALLAAEKEYESIVGERPPMFSLRQQGNSFSFDAGGQVSDGADQNPDVLFARQNQRLGELAVTRAKSAWIPELSASFTMTDLDGVKDNFTGLSLSLPLQAGNIFGMYSADANLAKLREETRDKERRVTLEIGRLIAMVESGVAEVEMRQSAIAAAELSVESNEKSYKGGVRTLLDVLASIEVLYSVKNDYVKSLLGLADNLLNVRIQQGADVAVGLKDVDALLLN